MGRLVAGTGGQEAGQEEGRGNEQEPLNHASGCVHHPAGSDTGVWAWSSDTAGDGSDGRVAGDGRGEGARLGRRPLPSLSPVNGWRSR